MQQNRFRSILLAVVFSLAALVGLSGLWGAAPVLATDGCFTEKFETVEVFEVETSEEARAQVTRSSSNSVVITIIDSSIDIQEGSEASADLTLCPMSDDDLRSWLDQEGPPFYFVNNTGDSSMVVIAVMRLLGPHGGGELPPVDEPPCTTVLRYTFCG
jgi:hypothetical protein